MASWRDGERCGSAGEPLREEDFRRRFAALNAWITSNPSSSTAHIALAELTVDYAWLARGGAWKVADAELFTGRLAEATKILELSAEFSPACPRRFAVLERLARGTGASRQEMDDIFDMAVSKFPAYWPAYFLKGGYLVPRWYGAKGEWQAFAKVSADRLGGDAGDILYARIVWWAARTYGPQADLTESKESSFPMRPVSIAWDRVERGLQLIRDTGHHATGAIY